jgi:hypothetical protein
LPPGGGACRAYVDNRAVYRSNYLALVCAKLGITLIHSRPYVPQGRGKIERFFRTVRLQLMPRLTPQDLRSLDALNSRLWEDIAAQVREASEGASAEHVRTLRQRDPDMSVLTEVLDPGVRDREVRRAVRDVPELAGCVQGARGLVRGPAVKDGGAAVRRTLAAAGVQAADARRWTLGRRWCSRR